MLKIFNKFAPLINISTKNVRYLSTQPPMSFSKLVSERINWELPVNLSGYSKTLCVMRGYSIELGDFPEENLYILTYNGKQITSFDQWPEKWVVPRARLKNTNKSAPKI